MAVVPGVASSYTVVVNIPGVDRIFLHCPGANMNYGCADVNWSQVKESALFHFGYPCFMANMYANDAQELTKMYKTAKELGVTTSMDPGMPDASGPAGQVDWKGVLERTLPYVDVFMPSADELLYMLDRNKFGKGDNLSASELSVLGDQMLAMGAAELTPVLRRGNDPTALNRMDAGMVTPETFSSMVNDLEVVKIPQIPKK